jgi:hypothetical protein
LVIFLTIASQYSRVNLVSLFSVFMVSIGSMMIENEWKFGFVRKLKFVGIHVMFFRIKKIESHRLVFIM